MWIADRSSDAPRTWYTRAGSSPTFRVQIKRLRRLFRWVLCTIARPRRRDRRNAQTAIQIAAATRNLSILTSTFVT